MCIRLGVTSSAYSGHPVVYVATTTAARPARKDDVYCETHSSQRVCISGPCVLGHVVTQQIRHNRSVSPRPCADACRGDVHSRFVGRGRVLCMADDGGCHGCGAMIRAIDLLPQYYGTHRVLRTAETIYKYHIRSRGSIANEFHGEGGVVGKICGITLLCWLTK